MLLAQSHTAKLLETKCATLLPDLLFCASPSEGAHPPPQPPSALPARPGQVGSGQEVREVADTAAGEQRHGTQGACKGLPPLLLESPCYPLHLMEPVQDPLIHLQGGRRRHKSPGLHSLTLRVVSGVLAGTQGGGHTAPQPPGPAAPTPSLLPAPPAPLPRIHCTPVGLLLSWGPSHVPAELPPSSLTPEVTCSGSPPRPPTNCNTPSSSPPPCSPMPPCAPSHSSLPQFSLQRSSLPSSLSTSLAHCLPPPD